MTLSVVYAAPADTLCSIDSGSVHCLHLHPYWSMWPFRPVTVNLLIRVESNLKGHEVVDRIRKEVY